MGFGFDAALDEITLVLFTTLAPSGTIAFMTMTGILLGARFDEGMRARMNLFLCIPLVTSMVGLVASATHLGNPANALYVFMNVGSSPLSDEVFCAVLFLICAGVYWLSSFSMRPLRVLKRVLLVVLELCGATFVAAVSFAYETDTVITWCTPYVPAALWLNALVGGSLLAVLSLYAARYPAVGAGLGRAMLVVSAVALAANTVVYVLQGLAYIHAENAVTSATELVPFYWPMLAAFVVLCAAGIAMMVCVLQEISESSGQNKAPTAARVSKDVLGRAIVATMLTFLGIFVMRFAFYMSHLTVGVGV